MTEEERAAFAGLVHTAQAIAIALECHPEKTALQLVGKATVGDDDLAILIRAIDRCGKLVYPAWTHRHADERPYEAPL